MLETTTGYFRIHIDRFDNPDKKAIWTLDLVDYNRYYDKLRSDQLSVDAGVKLTWIGPRRDQPRAFIAGFGTVTRDHTGCVHVEVAK